MAATKPAPPRDLSTRGRRFWRDVIGGFELTGAERHLLHEACRSLDRIDALEALVVTEGQTVIGSTGQTVLHPGIAEARQQRLVLGRLVKQLDLPEEDARPVSSASEKAAHAARERWSRGRGKGA